jgi:hypothetical protein
LRRPEDLDIKLSKDMLYIELKSEEVIERDLPLKVLFVENLNQSVLLVLRIRKITNLLLKRESEENYLL